MRLVYFAWVRERVGKTDEEVDLPPSISTVADLVRWLKIARRRIRICVRKRGRGARRDRPCPCKTGCADCRRARDRVFPAHDRRLGACPSAVRIQAEDFDIAAETAALTEGRPEIGAVVAFTGFCRDENGRLSALELEHYPGMAEAELLRLRREAANAMGPRRASRSSIASD